MQRPTPQTRRYGRAAGLCVTGPARLKTRPGRPCDGRGRHYLTWRGVAGRKWPPAAAGAALIVGSALAFALDGPVAQAAYQRGLDPATFGFWRASAGALVLGGCLAARLRPGAMAAVRQMCRAAAIRLALAAGAGLGLNLALFEAFARLPVAVAVAAFGCYPLFVAAWEAASRRPAAGAARLGMAVVAIAGLMLLIRPDRSASVHIAGLLLALLAAVLHAAYILLGRGGWDQVGDGTATFLIVATAALGLGALAAATRPATVLAPVSDPGLTGLLAAGGRAGRRRGPPALPGWPAPHRSDPDRGAVAVRTPGRHTARCRDVRPAASTISAARRRAAGGRRHRRPDSARPPGASTPQRSRLQPPPARQLPPAAPKRTHPARLRPRPPRSLQCPVADHRYPLRSRPRRTSPSRRRPTTRPVRAPAMQQ